MADLLQYAQRWLADRLKRCASRQITYQRGADSVVVSATVGRTPLRLDDGYGGTLLVWTDRDYLITAADLMLSGTRVLPQPGDLIVDQLDASPTTYEVANYGSEPAWRPSDPFSELLRIHTKLVGVA